MFSMNEYSKIILIFVLPNRRLLASTPLSPYFCLLYIYIMYTMLCIYNVHNVMYIECSQCYVYIYDVHNVTYV